MSSAKPWDKQEEEPSLWWERFNKFYRPLGPSRTLTQAYKKYYEEKHGKAPTRPGYTADWGRKAELHEWRRRAESWDEELHRGAIAAEKEASIEMTRRQMTDSTAVQTLAMNEIIKRGFASEKGIGTIVRAWKAAVEVERTARGIPDSLAKIGEMEEDELRRTLARELARASIREETQTHEPLSDGKDASESTGGQQKRDTDSVSGPAVPGSDGVSEKSGWVREGRTGSETEELSSDDATDSSE